MARQRLTTWLLAALVALLPCAMHAAQAGGPRQAPRMELVDVKLAAGALHGQLLDSKGQPLADQTLTVVRDEALVAQARTDKTGRFHCSGLDSGVYQVRVENRVSFVRVWRAEVAPPAAGNALLLVSGEVQRGQLGGINPLARLMSAEGFAVGVLAAAVLVPVAISIHHDDPEGS